MSRTKANEHEQKNYLNIIGGKFAEKAKPETEGAVKRYSEKKKQDVYEVLYKDITGRITEMKIDKTDYGKQLLLTVVDVDETLQINIPVESKYFDSFCAKIQSADLSKQVRLAPYSFNPKDKPETKMTGMNIFQDEDKMGYYYSKENPMGKPFPPEERMDEDDFKMFKLTERKFYMEMIGTENDKLQSLQPAPASARAVKPTNDPLATYMSPPDDDLPF